MDGPDPARPPLTFQVARVITLVQAVPALCLQCLYTGAVLSPDARQVGWRGLWFVVGVLGFVALAVTSAARLAPVFR
jgi:hypothetical protein